MGGDQKEEGKKTDTKLPTGGAGKDTAPEILQGLKLTMST